MVEPVNYYKISLETELKTFDRLRIEDIETIQQWVSTQPHLPTLLDVQVAHFLYASYYNVEDTKYTIEHFYTFKNSMKEFFTDWDPESKATSDFFNNAIQAAFLPKQSSTDCQVLLLRLKDKNVDVYSFNLGVKWLLMSVTSFVICEGMQSEFKIVYDAAGYSMSHVMRNPLSSVKNYIEFGQKASAIRVVEVHFINSSGVVRKLISILKPFMNKHLMKMLNFHSAPEGFFKTLQPEQIPSDYGGKGPSVETLHAENTQRVLSVKEALITHSQQKTDESKRIGKKKKNKVEEDFRKLDID